EETKSDIYLKNESTGENVFFLTIANVYATHSHFSEYHNNSVSVIRRVGYDGYPDGDWTDELWKYDLQKIGTKLFSGPGLDFRVSPNEAFIAVTHDINTPHHSVSILNKEGVVINTYTLKELGAGEWDEYIQLFSWSDDSKLFWGGTFSTDNPGSFFCMRSEGENCGIEIFHSNEIPDPIETEYKIESNTGKLVYSTFPVIFDVDSYKEYEKKSPAVYLKIYDFYTKQSKEIAFSKFKKFEPEWVGKDLIEYTDPKTQKRTRKKLVPILN